MRLANNGEKDVSSLMNKTVGGKYDKTTTT